MASGLTRRELECVQLAGDGLSDKQIQVRLGISYRTVQRHLLTAYDKLGVKDRRAAAAAVRRDYAVSPIPIADVLATPSTPQASFGGVGDSQLPGPIGWPLPPPPSRGWRALAILAFCALSALLTVGVVAVVGTAIQLLSTQAPPNGLRTLDEQPKGSSMKHPQIGVRIARRIHSAEHALDKAMIETSHLVSALLESRAEAGLAAEVGQDALERMVESMTQMTRARSAVVAGHTALAEVADTVGVTWRMQGPYETKTGRRLSAVA